MVGNHASYSAETMERMRLGNAGSPGIRMQFKPQAPGGRNLNLENPLQKNVSQLIFHFIDMYQSHDILQQMMIWDMVSFAFIE